jgi:hypothetical protein
MTQYFKDDKLYTESEIKALYPNTSFPTPFVAQEEFTLVFDTPKPETTELQVAYQDGTEIDSKGNRVIKWSIRDMFSDYVNEEGVAVTKAEQESEYLERKRKELVPKTITPRQARLALLQATLLDEVEAMVATDKSMGIWWEYSLEIERNSEHIINAGLALGLTEEQLDNLFTEGSKL